MNGKLYGVGVGPGDPELMTLKALRIIRQSDVIAIPGKTKEDCVAYHIARGACPELEEKSILPVPMPMTKDRAKLEENHEAAAKAIEDCLRQGKQVAFLTLGDPTVYSTYLYVHRKVSAHGFDTAIVSGIPSFCAVAAKINQGLVETSQALHVLPGTYSTGRRDEIASLSGTKVLMKTGKNMERVRRSILESGQDAVLVENCGMDGETVYWGAENFPDNPSYYSLIIVKE